VYAAWQILETCQALFRTAAEPFQCSARPYVAGDGGLKLYFTVKLTWIVLGTGTVLVALIAWKRPKAVVPLTLAIATAGVLAAIMRL
jgi:hypothetical protein